MVAVSALAVVMAPIGQAGGQTSGESESCTSEAASTATVTIDLPKPDEKVSGVIRVSGTASAPAPLSRVELIVGDGIVDSLEFSPRSNVTFGLQWQASQAPPGPGRLQVVACGSSTRGEATVSVALQRPRPLWVGLVLGVSGAAGLALCSIFRRERRPRRRPTGTSWSGPVE